MKDKRQPNKKKKGGKRRKCTEEEPSKDQNIQDKMSTTPGTGNANAVCKYRASHTSQIG